MFINYLLFINFEHYSFFEHDYKGRIIVMSMEQRGREWVLP